MLCRVKFDTQQAGNGEEIPLVKAAKTVFDSSDPSFWSLSALVAPRPLLPLIRLLARKFPSKPMQKSQKAFETLYDASNALIQVSPPKLASPASMTLQKDYFKITITQRGSQLGYCVQCLDHTTSQYCDREAMQFVQALQLRHATAPACAKHIMTMNCNPNHRAWYCN